MKQKNHSPDKTVQNILIMIWYSAEKVQLNT